MSRNQCYFLIVLTYCNRDDFIAISHFTCSHSIRTLRFVILKLSTLDLPSFRDKHKARSGLLKGLNRNNTYDSVLFGHRYDVHNRCPVVLPLKFRDLMDRKQEVLSPLRKDQNVLQRIHIKDILDIVAFLYTRACAFPAGPCEREHAGTLDVPFI
ncbi:hypothetical protein D3C74_311850 [compost metagenome]